MKCMFFCPVLHYSDFIKINSNLNHKLSYWQGRILHEIAFSILMIEINSNLNHKLKKNVQGIS